MSAKPAPRTRVEKDALGEVEVPADRYWGAQTQRALEHFRIGDQRWPRPFLRALGLIKAVAARVNAGGYANNSIHQVRVDAT